MMNLQEALQQALDDYVAAEDALRSFTDRNFGRMCATCARWTLLASRTNAERPTAVDGRAPGGDAGAAVNWRLSSWVTNCCNANHALESISESSLAGIVASREEGHRWWEEAKRAAGAPCAALTEAGCALKRGRPELCNTYFCEAVRDYLWMIGGERKGSALAERLDDLQRRWGKIYARYQTAILDAKVKGTFPVPHRLRGETGWQDFIRLLDTFDREIAACVRPVTTSELTDKLFKVSGDRQVFEPFFDREVAAIQGNIRAGTSSE
ncbi:MAG TPA: hypothetical protein VGW38_09970 [Chloroflexota bacterium]|nr:hypothetical protein [Chloroflexota bacterium]